MTVEELLQIVPESVRPVAAKYGPILIKMTAAEFWAWIELMLNGKTQEALQAVFAKSDDDELLTMGADLQARWSKANAENAANVKLQKQAALAILQALLTVALAMVGL